MNLPHTIIVPVHGDRTTAVEAICILLDRMTYPRKWSDLIDRYDRHESALSRIFNYTLHVLLKAAKGRLLLSPTATQPERLELYARAFHRRGVPDALRVIDVKKVKNCRPTTDQRAQYSGHTKYHCFKYQTLETPDGLVSHCSRCEDGRRGDGYILRQSNLLPFLNGHEYINRRHLVVFGDSAYPNNNIMVTMFRGRNLPPWATAFNAVLAKVRISVEWGSAQVCSKFAFVDWSRQLKIELMSVEAIWHVAVLFTNCHTCYFGRNQISDYFRCPPPSLDEYLSDFHVEA